MWKRIALFCILIITIEVPVFSQTGQSLFEQMVQAFQQIKYDKAEQIAKQITADYESATPFELLEAHKILGIIAFQRDMNREESQRQFDLALSIDPAIELDSLSLSPKTIEFFRTVKSKFLAAPGNSETEKARAYRYIIQPDPRPAATLRSMALPGWGQLYKNDRRKGYALITATMVTTLATGIFHVLQSKAHTDYMNAIEPDIIEQKYDSYNRLYKLRNNSALLAGGAWLYAVFDALIVKPKLAQRNTSISIVFKNHPSLVAQISF